jgi:hypothetical protein
MPEKREQNLHFTSSLFSYTDDEDHGVGWHERYKMIKGICEGLKYMSLELETSLCYVVNMWM